MTEVSVQLGADLLVSELLPAAAGRALHAARHSRPQAALVWIGGGTALPLPTGGSIFIFELSRVLEILRQINEYFRFGIDRLTIVMVTKQPQTGPLGLPFLVPAGEPRGLAELRVQLRLLGPSPGGGVAWGSRTLAVPGLL